MARGAAAAAAAAAAADDYRTAGFIDTAARSDKAANPANERRKVIKTFVLLGDLVLAAVLALRGPETVRGAVVIANAAVFVLRLWIQIWIFWERRVSWTEVLGEAFFIIPLSLGSLGWGASEARADDPFLAGESRHLDMVGQALFVVGTLLIAMYEGQRHLFKRRPENQGKLYTGGLAGALRCRHLNYFGEIVSFVGFGMVSGRPLFNQWIPLLMGLGLAMVSVPEIEFYLQRRYAAQWPAYERGNPYKLIPFVW